MNDNEAKLRRVGELVQAVLEGETDLIAGLANVSAVLMAHLERVNWAGFYILKGKDLVLGPFQGQVACSRIAEGRGVCGRAVQDGRTLLVPNVHEFADHIACDSASNSELVIPLYKKGGAIWGVLDLDSPDLGRFEPAETERLERVGELVSAFVAKF
jgi:GAF domain-containing protein